MYLRIDPDAAEARGQQRLGQGLEDGTDRFELEGPEFQRRVAAAYDELAERNPGRIVVVDAAGDPDDVHRRVVAAVRERRPR